MVKERNDTRDAGRGEKKKTRKQSCLPSIPSFPSLRAERREAKEENIFQRRVPLHTPL